MNLSLVLSNHLNHGLKFPLSDAQKKLFLKLNWEAGVKTKDAQALETAIEYYKNAISLLNSDSWESQYEMTFSIYKDLATCFQLTGSLVHSERCFNLCLEKAKTKWEKVYLYSDMINLLNQSQNFDQIFSMQKRLSNCWISNSI